MAKDDYFIVAYRILAYLYGCMKAGETPDMEVISFHALNIPERYWADVLESLTEEGFLKGVRVDTLLGNAVSVKAISPKITMAGIQFLEENSGMAKAKAFLKELKEMVPGL